jgi:hypothetical protein
MQTHTECPRLHPRRLRGRGSLSSQWHGLGYYPSTVTDSTGAAASAASRALMADEDAGWSELQALLGRLSLEQLERPGYFEEGWSAKDVLSHVGSWLAAAGAVLDRIRMGTYRRQDIDIDALNARFLELMKDVPLDAVRAQALSARARMLQAWNQLPDLTDEAAWWIRKAGAEHYAEHLPRLREWVRELQTGD